MLKRLLSARRVLGAFVCVLVLIAAGVVYLQLGGDRESGIAPESLIWTGKPLREVSAPDPLSPVERKARNAKIQALNTEIKQLVRATRAHMHKYNEQVDKYPKIRQEIKTISTELDTFLGAEDRTAEQQTRYDTLFKRYLELENLADEVLTIANEMREENRQLFEKRDALEAERDALRRR